MKIGSHTWIVMGVVERELRERRWMSWQEKAHLAEAHFVMRGKKNAVESPVFGDCIVK